MGESISSWISTVVKNSLGICSFPLSNLTGARQWIPACWQDTCRVPGLHTCRGPLTLCPGVELHIRNSTDNPSFLFCSLPSKCSMESPEVGWLGQWWKGLSEGAANIISGDLLASPLCHTLRNFGQAWI